MQRGLRILMLGWLGLWFGVIAPGHERGVVLLPGSKPGSASCCVTRGELVVDKGQKAPARAPLPVKSCAICKINATLTPPPTIHFHALELGLVALLPLPPPTEAPAIESGFVHFSRGPPVLS